MNSRSGLLRRLRTLDALREVLLLRPLAGLVLRRRDLPRRPLQAVAYETDRFGRTTRDGALTYTHDANGNRTSVGYPGAVTATFTHDFADREENLTVTTPTGTVSWVTSSSHFPSGPLTSLTLGNGLTETRTFDGRYAPTGYSVTGSIGATDRTWTYTTDLVGNILGTTASVTPVYSSSGLLHSLLRPSESVHVLYFAGRPVGQVTIDGSGAESLLYYTVDHLGTPSLATDGGGGEVWSGGFEPFGRDWQEETAAGASENGVDLRFHGLWQDRSWSVSGSSLTQYGVNRWYTASIGSPTGPHPTAYFYEQPGVSRQQFRDPIGRPSVPVLIGQAVPETPSSSIARGPWAQVFCFCGPGGTKFTWRWVDPPVRPYRDCVEGCVAEHEEDHIDYLERNLPNSCRGRRDGEVPTAQKEDIEQFQNCSECSAYSASANCFATAYEANSRKKDGAYCRLITGKERVNHEAERDEYCGACGS